MDSPFPLPLLPTRRCSLLLPRLPTRVLSLPLLLLRIRHRTVPNVIVRNQRLQPGAHTHRGEQRAIALDLLQRPVAPPYILLHPVDSAPDREPCEHRIHVAMRLIAREILPLDFPVLPHIKRPREPFFLEDRARSVGSEMSQKAAAQQRRMLQSQS